MQEIEKLRQEIDGLHADMVKLFKRRLQVTRKIWEIKKQTQQPLIDPKREQLILHQFDQTTSDLEEQQALQNFMKAVLTESKRYVEAKLK